MCKYETFYDKQYTNIITYFPLGWTWRLWRAWSGAGRVAVDSRVVCTALYDWVLCNLRLLYGNTLMMYP